ncbi:type IV secretion protein Rhs [Microbacterium hominis]|uniref:Type IV secretion protein Rhs n=2 Tax=Microbacterium hominis TaxID=162426 RepID=A0A0B4DTG6_9MICO|nr:type IV secretion protein Rhs [Microbacterium hominis]
MTRNDDERPPLRQRVRDAGGWYTYLNTRLIRLAGPASVGPYESEPEPARAERACPLCGHAMSQHTFDRSGPKPLMHCP